MTTYENGYAAVSLYVPRPGTHAASAILPMSGIVGTAAGQWRTRDAELHLHPALRPGLAGDPIVLDYEGAQYGQANLVTYHDRVVVAAGRHTSHYPTVARRACPLADLQHVGFYYPDQRKIDVPGPNELMALTRWLTSEDGEGPNLHVEVRPGSYVA